MIEWLPVEDLPEAFKDGRGVLFWIDGTCHAYRWLAEEQNPRGPTWFGAMNEPIELDGEPTHFAEINPPARPR